MNNQDKSEFSAMSRFSISRSRRKTSLTGVLALGYFLSVCSYSATAGIEQQTIEASGFGVFLDEVIGQVSINVFTQVNGEATTRRTKSSLSVQMTVADGNKIWRRERKFQDTVSSDLRTTGVK